MMTFNNIKTNSYYLTKLLKYIVLKRLLTIQNEHTNYISQQYILIRGCWYKKIEIIKIVNGRFALNMTVQHQ